MYDEFIRRKHRGTACTVLVVAYIDFFKRKASPIFKERNSFHLPMSPIKCVDGERNKKQSAISFLKPVQSKMRNSFIGCK